MPYKSEHIKLIGLQDRRRRLTDEQKEEIKELYATGLYSLRGLGKRYGVSKSTISFIVNPKRAEAVRNYRKEHWKDYVTSKEEHARVIREHRRYKQSLYLKGELKCEGSDYCEG